MIEQQDLFGGLKPAPRPPLRRFTLGEMTRDRFKLESGIVCWLSAYIKQPWIAYRSPPGHESSYPADVIATKEEWLIENGFMAYGETEGKAVTQLCYVAGIMMPIHLMEDI